MPSRCKYNKRNVSKKLIKTPYIKSIPKSKFSPIAIPSISAKSQAAIAISAKI